MNLPLKGFNVVDLSHRLPGPMAGKILQDLGASVTKIEDQKFRDPFLSGLFANFDKSFIDWYDNLNRHKKVLRFDFNNSNDQKEIQNLVKNADAVIMGIPENTRQKLGLLNNELTLNKPFVVIELLASKTHQRSLHDLNSLADEGLLSLHVQGRNELIVDPPFLPIAGISFGHKGATDLLAHWIVALKNNQTVFAKTYMDEATREIFGIFWPNSDRDNHRKKYLHNGQYPCYSIYQTKDAHYVAIAAVEEKFWNRFCELFSLDAKVDRFNDRDRSVFDLISKKISSLPISEIKKIVGEEDICMSFIP